MHGPFTIAGIGMSLVVGTVATLGGVGLHDIVEGMEPSRLAIDALEYDPGADVVTYLPRAPGVPEAERYRARWLAEVLRVDTPGTEPVCEGTATGRYYDRRSPAKWSLDYMVEGGCRARLAPGRYELLVELHPRDGSRMTSRHAYFTITENMP